MLLSASTLWGGLYLIILFGLCFCVVVGIKALRIEYRNRQRKEPRQRNVPVAEKQPESAKPQPKPRTQKVYYIVEKKKTKRAKEELTEPKKIEFSK